MLNAIIIFFHVMACLTLILVILLQVGRGHGLSGASFSQSGVQTVFGTKTADFLTKATTTMAIIFVITCISLDIMHSRKSKSLFAPGAGTGSMSKADMEKIKQVLEKIKAEQAAKGPSQGGTVPKSGATVSEKPVSSPPVSAQTSAKSTQATVPSPQPPGSTGGKSQPLTSATPQPAKSSSKGG